MNIENISYSYDIWPKNIKEVDKSLSKLSLKVWEDKEIQENDPVKKAKKLINDIKICSEEKWNNKDKCNAKKKELYKLLLINQLNGNKVWDYNDYRIKNKENRNQLKNEFIQLIKHEYEEKWEIALDFLDTNSWDNHEILEYYINIWLSNEQIQKRILSLINIWISWIQEQTNKKNISHFDNINKIENFMVFIHDSLSYINNESDKNEIFIKAKELINLYPKADKLIANSIDKNEPEAWALFDTTMYSLNINGMSIEDNNNCGAALLFGWESNSYYTFEWQEQNSIVDRIMNNQELRIYYIWDKVYIYNNLNNYKEVPLNEFNQKKTNKQKRTYVKELNIPRRNKQKEFEETWVITPNIQLDQEVQENEWKN